MAENETESKVETKDNGDAREEAVKLTPEIQAYLDNQIDDVKKNYAAEISGLSRTNTKLKKDLDTKETSGKSVEERIAKLEKVATDANSRADTMEAFGKAGLSEDWRELFDISDPTERATVLKGLLEDHAKNVSKKTATSLIRDPEKVGGGKTMYTMEQAKDLGPKEINRLYSEGRIIANTA
jgi:hypothetical protein